MPNSYTSNLNMTKPEVGADTDAWGGHLNDDLDVLDGIFKSDGTGTSVGMKVGAGKTLAVAGTLTATGTVTATAATVALGASNTSVKDTSDATKVMKFDVSGVSTGTTRTFVAPDKNGTLAVTTDLSTLLPAGSVIPYAGSSAPTGYLLCDGSAVSRTTYATLFAVIGTTYGAGNGTTTFNVPDITGRVIAGKEATATRLTTAGGGVDGGTLGATGGAQTETASVSSTGTASGSLTVSASGTTDIPSSDPPNRSGDQGVNVAGSAHVHTVTVTGTTSGTMSVTATGTTASATNVQPTIVLLYVIKT
jgi:hypothetical protein